MASCIDKNLRPKVYVRFNENIKIMGTLNMANGIKANLSMDIPVKLLN
jgi:hypothetical protein